MFPGSSTLFPPQTTSRLASFADFSSLFPPMRSLDVLAVSESWLYSSVKNAEVEIQGYKISRLDRQKKIGGGVCICTRPSFKTKVLKDLQVQHKEIIVLGDLSCDLLKSCCEGNTLKDLCDTLKLNQLETSPARVTPQLPFLIDVIVATKIKHQCCQGN